MARPKAKEYSTFSMRMDSSVKTRLDQFCEESGMSKTTAVERAITMFVDDWDAKQARINELDNRQAK